MNAFEPKNDKEELPDAFSVSVIMQQSPANSRWVDHTWEAVGVSVGDSAAIGAGGSPLLIYEEGAVRRYLYPGFRITLHVDECESYYHNLMTPTPRCYVVADPGDGETPVPLLVSLSFDEAHAYLEGDQSVYAVDIPPELYRWSEDFVLRHYVPEKKKKRRLKDWSEDGEAALQHER